MPAFPVVRADLMFQGNGGTDYITPDLTDVFQELVAQRDWPEQGETAMVLIIEQAEGAHPLTGGEHPIWRPMSVQPRIDLRYVTQGTSARCVIHWLELGFYYSSGIVFGGVVASFFELCARIIRARAATAPSTARRVSCAPLMTAPAPC